MSKKTITRDDIKEMSESRVDELLSHNGVAVPDDHALEHKRKKLEKVMFVDL